MKKILTTIYSFLLTVPAVFATNGTGSDKGRGIFGTPDENLFELPNPFGTTNIVTLLNRVIAWALGFLIAISVLFIIYAAFIYLTSAGDVEKVKKANKIILYTAIAIAVGLLSRAIIAVIQYLLS